MFIAYSPHWLQPVSDNSTSGFPTAEYTACSRVLLNMSKCACTLKQETFYTKLKYSLSPQQVAFLFS